ncbi:uncharacterized protein LOC107983774 [Anolis carolinensis]|uniref:uncharacterized protein LOC107983774 n=1 Tax=Anolis carolinensis TaxID=28377 RepID=UPI002F2B7BFC
MGRERLQAAPGLRGSLGGSGVSGHRLRLPQFPCREHRVLLASVAGRQSFGNHNAAPENRLRGGSGSLLPGGRRSHGREALPAAPRMERRSQGGPQRDGGGSGTERIRGCTEGLPALPRLGRSCHPLCLTSE